MSTDKIVIKGAREHNLKNVDVTIPRDKLIVMTGLSGSGKSSLAFDTIYADGQRRYMESLSSYARQFLGQMEKPDVDEIQGLSPAISIDQKTTSRNPRSTVGTVTEIYDYLRLMYARIGIPHCPVCGRVISQQTVDQMVDEVLRLPEGVLPVTTVTLGWPEEMPPLTDRLPLEGVVHRERYEDYTPETIDRIWAEREASPETAELLRANGLPNLARIFTERRYTAEDNRLFSRKYFDMLKKQGFFNQ